MKNIARALAAVMITAAAGVPNASAQGADSCNPGQGTQFSFGFADLRSQVGNAMGDAIECEHANPENGDTLQRTTTGLSFYRKSTNTPTFTNGSDHWGLTTDGLAYWIGTSIDPPGVASPPAQPEEPTPAAIVAPTSTPVAELSEADVAALAARSVVQILNDDGSSGSGVRIPEGVLTNAHVVKGHPQVRVFAPDGKSANGTVTRLDEVRDLAIVTTDLSLTPMDREPSAQQRQGQTIVVLGYPLGIGGQATVSRGLLSATRVDRNGST